MQKISDLGLVTALVTLGSSIRETETDDKGRVSFLFDNTEEIKDISERYFNKNLMVDANTYFYAIKSIKNTLYQIKDGKQE